MKAGVTIGELAKELHLNPKTVPHCLIDFKPVCYYDGFNLA